MSGLLPMRPTVEDTGGDPEVLELDEAAADDVFETLSSETTRAVLACVYEEPRTASEIADAVDTSLQNVSYHLDKLQDEDLVEVAGTGYSRQGREQKVYAPTSGSLVILATDDEDTASSLRSALGRLLGAVAVLGLLGVVFDRVVRWVVPQRTTFTLNVKTGSGDTATPVEIVLDLLASPGGAFVIGGLTVLVVLWAARRYGGSVRSAVGGLAG